MKECYNKVKCPVCCSEKIYTLYPDTLKDKAPLFNYSFSPEHTLTYQISKCKNCGHAFSVSIPDNFCLNYNDIIDVDYIKSQDQRLLTYRKVIKRLLRLFSFGHLLDVGCATGDFLSIAKSHYEVEGLEPSKWACKIAQEREFIVHNCFLNEIKVANLYDIVTLWGVVEHFENPKKEIEHISKLLKIGGYVCLWTGDIESLPARLLGRKWWYIQGQHIQFFSKRSLTKLFNDSGFEKVTINIYPYVATFQSLAASLGRYPYLGKFIRNIVNKCSFIRNFSITLLIPGEMFAIFKKVK